LSAPHRVNFIEKCQTGEMREGDSFSSFPAATLQMFQNIKDTVTHAKGILLFVEGESPRGIFVLCQGRVKLSVCSGTGKTLIFKIAETGAVLGLCATINGQPYELTAETLDTCQLKFVRREDFLRFLSEHKDAWLGIARYLLDEYSAALGQIRTLGLAQSAEEKLANFLLKWGSTGEAVDAERHIKLPLTHDEIAQMIGTSRETVTRLLSDLKKRQVG